MERIYGRTRVLGIVLPQDQCSVLIIQLAMSKARDYCFTLNNYTDAHIQALEDLDCVYIVYGKEVGESGTPHLQGYVRWASPRTFNATKTAMPDGTHIERKKGTCKQAIDYCKKDGDVYERGDPPMTQEEKGAANKRRYAEALDAAKEGRFDDIPEDLYTRHYQTYKKIREDYLPKPQDLDELENEWRYGPTGTGKSRSAHEMYPNAYIKKADTIWWDGYNGEDVVIIDDFDKYHVKLGYQLKIWLDHYKFQAERKGGSSYIRPKKIIITSNYHPRDIWDDEKTLNPVLRRVTLVPYGEIGSMDYQGYCNPSRYRNPNPEE